MMKEAKGANDSEGVMSHFSPLYILSWSHFVLCGIGGMRCQVALFTRPKESGIHRWQKPSLTPSDSFKLVLWNSSKVLEVLECALIGCW